MFTRLASTTILPQTCMCKRWFEKVGFNNNTQQKIPGSVKKWKVPGIKCITTVKPNN